MKRLIYLIAIIPFMLGCERDPFADFFVSRDVVEVGDIIYFTNNSMDADNFEWDFGDGILSFEYNPQHIYTTTGIYQITLTAFQGNRTYDRASITIEVLFPTSLEVTVLEYYDEYPVSDASVILYETLDDWNDEYNPLVEGFTNQYGRVTFSNLNTRNYYLDVWEEYHNNWQLAEEDIAWIETDRLEANEMNYFIAYVDYVPPVMKSEGRPQKNLKILKMEKLDKRTYLEKTDRINMFIENRKKDYRNEEVHQAPVIPKAK